MSRLHWWVHVKCILLLSGWLPTPAGALPLMAAARSAETQKCLCNAVPVTCVVRAVERLRSTRLALAAARRRLHRLKVTAMTARRCTPPRSSPSRSYSGELGTITHGSRQPTTDVRDAATNVGHAGSYGAKVITMTPLRPSERARLGLSAGT